MTNQLIVKQDNLELRTKKLSMPFRTFEHGPMRYDFPFVFVLDVEEIDQNGTIIPGTLRYENSKRVFLDDGSVDGLRGNYSHDSPFTTQFNDRLSHIMDEIFYAIEDYKSGKVTTRTGITITDESAGEYGNRLYLDLSR